MVVPTSFTFLSSNSDTIPKALILLILPWSVPMLLVVNLLRCSIRSNPSEIAWRISLVVTSFCKSIKDFAQIDLLVDFTSQSFLTFRSEQTFDLISNLILSTLKIASFSFNSDSIFEKSVSGGDEVWIDYVQPSDGCTNDPSNIELGVCNEFSNSLNLKVEGLEGGKFSVSGESKDELGCEYITTFSGNDGVVTGTSNDNGSCEFKLETVNDRYLVCSN